jgi:cobaltochelatase CobS
MPLSPSNSQRRELRRAISAHPDWPAYRAASGVGDTSTLSGARCLDICAALGLNAAALLFGNAAPAAPAAPAPAPAPVAPAGLFNPTPTTRAPVAPAQKAPAMPAPTDLAAALAVISDAINNPAPAVDLAPLEARLDDLAARVADLAAPAPVLIACAPDGSHLGQVTGARHPMLETLLRAVSARDASGYRLNVWLAGPAGSGKTHAAKQIASALDLEFGFHGSMSMPHELLGFVDAGGKYHETVFVRLYQAGGVCLLDEIDAGSDEARLSINAALANGLLSLPDGRIVSRHADFICIGAANTWGAGATADYVGRAKIDAATLSRFPVKLAWDYDRDLEKQICGDPAWAEYVQAARQRARDAGLKHQIDPRHSMAGAALVAAGFSFAEAADLTYLAGLSDTQRAMVQP